MNRFTISETKMSDKATRQMLKDGSRAKTWRLIFILITAGVLVISLFGCMSEVDPAAQRVNSQANLQYAENDSRRVEWDGQKQLELARAEADAIRTQADAEAYVTTSEARALMLTVQQWIAQRNSDTSLRERDAAHERGQENLIALSAVTTPTSAIILCIAIAYSIYKDKGRDRQHQMDMLLVEERINRQERLGQEAERRYWHAVAQSQRSP